MDLVGQRIFGIACGHPDCNDGDRLADDAVHKLLLDRDPDAGRPNDHWSPGNHSAAGRSTGRSGRPCKKTTEAVSAAWTTMATTTTVNGSYELPP